MKDPRIVKFAEVLVNYSVDVKKGETLLVSGPPAAEPLLKEVYRAGLARGAHVIARLECEALDEIFYAAASEEEIDYLSPIPLFEAAAIDALIRISAASNTRALSGIDPRKQARRARAVKPMRDVILEKRWCGTLYPTAAYAQDADMSLTQYEDFVFRAVFADKKDPIREWRGLSAMQDRLIKWLKGRKTVRVVGEGTDLSFSVEGRTWVNSDGKHNMPSGEIFTTPVEGSVNGEITYSFPAIHGGREVDGIRLVFRNGEVAEAHAKKNEEYLKAMIASDAGARIVGEFGVGTNSGITKFTKSILYDEKIGGTIHVALGESYAETGGKNKSALHWDMICDLRKGGEILVDGEVFEKDGKFLN
jgi:aminopeptidase